VEVYGVWLEGGVYLGLVGIGFRWFDGYVCGVSFCMMGEMGLFSALMKREMIDNNPPKLII
jgi:hypothetical protein